MSDTVLLSPEARINGGLHTRNFYHVDAGFGLVREGYAGEDFCVVTEFEDLGGVGRIDRENVVLGEAENAQRIVLEAISVVMRREVAGFASEPAFSQVYENTRNPGRTEHLGQQWAGQPNSQT